MARIELADQATLDAWIAAGEAEKNALLLSLTTELNARRDELVAATATANASQSLKSPDLLTGMRIPTPIGYSGSSFNRPNLSQEAIDYCGERGIPLYLPLVWHSTGNIVVGTSSAGNFTSVWQTIDGGIPAETDFRTVSFETLLATRRVNPIAFGTEPGRIPTLNWVLNKWGGKVPIILDPLVFSTGTQARIDLFAAVTRRNMHKSVAMISSSKNFSADVRLNGCTNIMTSDTTSNGGVYTTFSGNNETGINGEYWSTGQPGANDPYIGITSATPDSVITTLRTNFPNKPLVYRTLSSNTRRNFDYNIIAAKGVSLIVSDDPEHNLTGGIINKWNTDNFGNRLVWPGFKGVNRGIFIGPNWYGRHTSITQYNTTGANGFALLNFLGRRTTFSLELDLQMDNHPSNSITGWASLMYGTVSSDEVYVDNAQNVREVINGYQGLIRRNGQIQIFKIVDGLTNVLAQSAVPGTPLAPVGTTTGIKRMRFEVLSDRVRFTNLTDGTTIETLDTSYRQSAFINIGNSAQNVRFRNVEISDV